MLVAVPPLAFVPRSEAAPTGDPYPFAETPLIVAFAADDLPRGVSAGTRVALADAPEISHDDAYLVLPVRARGELVAAFARGAVGRVARWLDEAVVVRAEVDGGRAARLWVGAAWTAREVLAACRGRAVAMDAVGDPLRVINRLPFVVGLAAGGLFDATGAAAVTTRPMYMGVARMGVAELGLGADAVEPSFVWSERDGAAVRVLMALAAPEDDSILALLAPLTLTGV